MPRKTRVLLADDHRVFRDGLRLLLQAQANVEVVGEAGDGRAAVRMARELSPDVVVMDVHMPDLNGIESTRQITGHNAGGRGPKVIGLSAHASRKFTAEMLAAGAAGYVLKDAAFDELAVAVRSVVADEVYLSPTIADGVADDLARRGGGGGAGGNADAGPGLSPREREVLQLMAEGRTTKEIALHLGLSAKTVETHRRNLMEKLDLFSVPELTRYALREGITSLEHG